ncbi:MAG: CARDB domain-containing protein [Methanomassiliicoccales archaeon]|jgi:hypothetical protein|nr:CARDB domain-containing protein [Methanomassiliicoccales archaeon]
MSILVLLIYPLTSISAASYDPIYVSVDGRSCIATGEKSEYVIRVIGGPGEEPGGNFSFTAKLIGPSPAEAKVIPTNGKSPTGLFRVNVTAPPKAQDMVLRINVSSVSANGTLVEKVTKDFPIKVLVPVVITATVVNDGNMSVKNIPVAIYADGSKIYETTINLDPKTSKTIVYNWTDPYMKPGEHVITVSIDPGNSLVKLDTGGTTFTATIFVGKTDYGLVNALLVGILLLSIFSSYLVYRRPKRRRMKR